MRAWGYIELLRRGVTLALVTGGLATYPAGRSSLATAMIAAGLLCYIFIPREKLPAHALTYERLPAIIGPDLLGVLLTSVFLALPFWARMGEANTWSLVHPSALLVWPLAAITVYILFVAARYASMWIVVEPEGLQMASLRGERRIAFSEIREVLPYRRGLPRWLTGLAPLLAATGHYTQAGALMLARDTSGVSLQLRSGETVVIEADGFERGIKTIFTALQRHGLPVPAGLKRAARRRRTSS